LDNAETASKIRQCRNSIKVQNVQELHQKSYSAVQEQQQQSGSAETATKIR
ncbi:Hypothetical predicted protein, partial [Pelobates cultripes]